MIGTAKSTTYPRCLAQFLTAKKRWAEPDRMFIQRTEPHRLRTSITCYTKVSEVMDLRMAIFAASSRLLRGERVRPRAHSGEPRARHGKLHRPSAAIFLATPRGRGVVRPGADAIPETTRLPLATSARKVQKLSAFVSPPPMRLHLSCIEPSPHNHSSSLHQALPGFRFF